MRLPAIRLQVITGDEVAEEYGVNKSSYDPVTLPNIKAYQVCASPSLDAARAAELGSMGLGWAGHCAED